jgi:hypothetical protein
VENSIENGKWKKVEKTESRKKKPLIEADIRGSPHQNKFGAGQAKRG